MRNCCKTLERQSYNRQSGMGVLQSPHFDWTSVWPPVKKAVFLMSEAFFSYLLILSDPYFPKSVVQCVIICTIVCLVLQHSQNKRCHRSCFSRILCTLYGWHHFEDKSVWHKLYLIFCGSKFGIFLTDRSWKSWYRCLLIETYLTTVIIVWGGYHKL